MAIASAKLTIFDLSGVGTIFTCPGFIRFDWCLLDCSRSLLLAGVQQEKQELIATRDGSFCLLQ